MQIKRTWLAAVVAAGLLAGCSKKEEAATEQAPATPAAEGDAPAVPAPRAAAKAAEEAPNPANDKLPGASGVRNDLSKKNWMGALEGLFALKQMAATAGGDTWVEWRSLGGEVGGALQEASATDAEAAKALRVYAQAMYGSQ